MALKQTQISKMASPNKGLKIWAEHLISLSILQMKICRDLNLGFTVRCLHNYYLIIGN